MILPYVDTPETDRPVFHATTTCPSPTPFILGGIVVGMLLTYLIMKR